MSGAAPDPSGRRGPPDPAEPTVALPTPLTPSHTIPPGTRIHDYRIDRVLGEGGFGIVYLATDVVLERQVAIKEYLPSSMAARAGQSLTVLVKSPVHQETFSIGLRSFVNEAKLLARFDHPALVKVHQFWEQNGTAYMAMPYYQGPTLKTALAQLGRLPTEAEVRAWLMPLLDALEVLHKAHCYHRDIAPDNILLTDKGPLLLDFGAARRVIGDLTHALTAMLKPGFAPIEQYGDMPGVTQGPWTDIFALASVLYAAISGGRTMASVERLLHDGMRPLSTVAAGRAGNAFLSAVDVALSIHPKDRPQSIAEFRTLLTADDTQTIDLLELRALGLPGNDADATVLLPDFDPTGKSAPAAPQQARQQPASAPVPAAPVPAPTPASAPRPVPAPPPTPRPAAPRPPAPPPAAKVKSAQPPPRAAGAAPAAAPLPRRTLVLSLAGSAAVVGLAWGGYYVLAPQRAATPAISTAPVETPASAPVFTPAASSPIETAASSVAPAPGTPASAAPAQSVPAPVPASASISAPSPAPAPASAPARAHPSPAAPKPRAAVPAPAPAPTTAAAKGERCSDILQKASLEPLTASEAAYLKKECR